LSARPPRAAPLSRRARSIEVSPTVAVAQRAQALKAEGRRILDFSVGEPDQPTPERIAAAGIAAIRAGRTRYAPAAGIPELRAAVAERYRLDDGAGFAPAEAAITVGGKQALYLVAQCLVDAGSEVVVPTPHWATLSETVRLAGGRPVLARARAEDGFRVTARLVSRHVTPKTRAVILNTPSNPTGAMIDPEELLAIARLARRRGFTVLYDDTYSRLSFDGPAPPPLREVQREAGGAFVVVGTASKTYCMTGWRIGWVLGPKALVDACAALISHSTQCPATFAQVAAVEALTGPQDLVGELAAEYRRRRDFLHPALAALPGIRCARPAGAFYLFPDVTGCLSRDVPDTVVLATRLLEEQGVALVPGEGFGAPGHVRLSFARPLEELREGAGRLATFLAGVGGVAASA
jgi:aspartate aminotransferase